MKMEQTECSETSAYKIQMPGNYPEENIQHTEQGESLKSRIQRKVVCFLLGNYPASKFRCRGITQKKTHNIQNVVKV
jgi:hypothetical protein